ncbi:MAG: signal peptidase II [bacterium]|nr:signal peptidase II [bacterium]
MNRFFTKFLILITLMFVGCNTDLHTKRLAFDNLRENSTVTVLDGFIDLSYVENKGMVFGVLNDIESNLKYYLLTGLTFSAILFMIYAIWRIRTLSFFYHLPFFLILSGAFGNFINRLTSGHVVDFIHIYWKNFIDFPYIFNVADVLILIGEIMLITLVIFKRNVFENVAFEQSKITPDIV